MNFQYYLLVSNSCQSSCPVSKPSIRAQSIFQYTKFQPNIPTKILFHTDKYVSTIFFFSVQRFCSPSSIFLIEGVHKSKKLTCLKLIIAPKPWGYTPFQTPRAILGPLVAILDFARSALLQAVWCSK